MAKIFWTLSNKLQLAANVANQCLQLKVTKPSLKMIANMLDTAQVQVLPEELRRKHLAPCLLGWLEPMVHKAIAEPVVKMIEVPSESTIEQQQQPPTQSLNLQAVTTEDLLRALVQRAQPMLAVVMQEIRLMVADTVSETLKQELEFRSFGIPAVTQVKHNPQPIGPIRTKRPRVLIAGMQPPEGHVLEQQYAGIEFLFWNKENNINVLKNQAKVADKVFVMTKFIGHAAENITRQLAASQPIRVNGAIKSLQPLLNSIVNGHEL